MNVLELFAAKKVYVYGEEKACPVCSKIFRQRDADTDRHQAKYCSGACRNKAREIHIEKPCVVCKKVFKPIRGSNVCCSRECGKLYRLSRRTVDPLVPVRKRLAVFCCQVIARCLRNKTDRTAKMLGYSVEQLRTHLEQHFEQGMAWDNYGKGAINWSIDHTRPISSFKLTASVAEINALENLRPMWHSKNCSKKNKWEGQ